MRNKITLDPCGIAETLCEVNGPDPIRDRDVFIVVNGVKIAQRGHPGTPEAGTWIALHPGWRVTDVYEGEVMVEYLPSR